MTIPKTFKVPLPTRDSYSTQYKVPRFHLSPYHKWHLGQLSCFWRAHGCVQQTDRHTHTHTHRDTMLHLQRQVAALQLTWAATADCPHIWNTRRVSFAWHYSLSLSWQSTINTQPQLFRKSTRAETTTVKIIRSWSSTSMHIRYATLMCAQKLT